VGAYNATTGALNPTFGGGGIITGLNQPVGIAVSGNALFVANGGGGWVD